MKKKRIYFFGRVHDHHIEISSSDWNNFREFPDGFELLQIEIK